MGRIQRTCRAGRPARSANAGLVQQQQNSFGLHALEGDIRCVRQPRLFGPVARRAFDPAQDVIFQPVSQSADSSVFIVQRGQRQLGCSTEADDIRRIFCAAAPASFLPAADDVRMIFRAPFDIEQSDSFRGVQFVRRQRQKVHAQLLDVHLQIVNLMAFLLRRALILLMGAQGVNIKTSLPCIFKVRKRRFLSLLISAYQSIGRIERIV